VYSTHVDAMRVQVTRTPFAFPKLQLCANGELVTEIDQFKSEHIAIEGYQSHSPIKMEMAV
jgi:thymidylate synthase